MADQYRVIQCPVAELQARLNELAEDFAPFVFAFSTDIPASSVNVILVRPPRQQLATPLGPIQGLGRRQ